MTSIPWRDNVYYRTMRASPYRFAWAACAVMTAVVAAWIWTTGRAVTGFVFAASFPFVFLCLTFAASLLRDSQIGETVAHIADPLAVLFYAGTVAPVASYVVLALTPFPLADGVLLRADQWLGFDWNVWMTWMSAHPQVQQLLRRVYVWLFVECMLCIVFLGARRNAARLVTAIMITVLITLALFGLLPAVGHVTRGSMAAHFTEIHSGGMRVISLVDTDGFISFPSFHTSLALLLAVAVRRTVIAIPMYVFTVVMLVAIPGVGAHYLVDMAAGALIASLAWYIAGAMHRPREGNAAAADRRAQRVQSP